MNEKSATITTTTITMAAMITTKITSVTLKENKAVYTAYVAPSRPKSKSITYGRTDGPTDRQTDTRSYRVASSRLKNRIITTATTVITKMTTLVITTIITEMTITITTMIII